MSGNLQRDLLSRRVPSCHFDLGRRFDEFPSGAIPRLPDLGQEILSAVSVADQLHSPWDLAAFDEIGPSAGQNLASLVPQQHRMRKQRFETVFAGQLVLCDAMCNSGAGFYTPYSRPLKESMSDSLEYLMIHVAECSFVTHGAAVDSRTTSSGATVRCTAAKSLESRSAAAASSNRVTATDPIITRG